MQDGAYLTATPLVRVEFHKTNSVVSLRRAFKLKFNVDPPIKNPF